MAVNIKVIQFNMKDNVFNLKETDIKESNITVDTNQEYILFKVKNFQLDKDKGFWLPRIIFSCGTSENLLNQPYLFKIIKIFEGEDYIINNINRLISFKVDSNFNLNFTLHISKNLINKYFSNLKKEELISTEKYLQEYIGFNKTIS